MYNRREHDRAEEQRLKQKGLVSIAYRTAALIGIFTWEPKKAPTLEKAFPEWFTEEQPTVPLWKQQQAGMAAYVAAYNQSYQANQKER